MSLAGLEGYHHGHSVVVHPQDTRARLGRSHAARAEPEPGKASRGSVVTVAVRGVVVPAGDAQWPFDKQCTWPERMVLVRVCERASMQRGEHGQINQISDVHVRYLSRRVSSSPVRPLAG